MVDHTLCICVKEQHSHVMQKLSVILGNGGTREKEWSLLCLSQKGTHEQELE